MTYRPQTGVTLIELLVTLSIAVILMTIAVPGFQDFFRRNRVEGAASNLVAALNYARSEAIRRGVRVTVCGSSNPQAATPDCVANAWSAGWIVFVDGVDPRGARNNGDEVLRIQALSDLSITAGGNIAKAVTFLASGRPHGVANDTFVVCAGGVRRHVILNAAGRVRAENATGACP